jgi:hypothetical protein
VTPKADGCELLGLMALKSVASLIFSKAAFNWDSAYLMAEWPEILASDLVILSWMIFVFGVFSASTKFWARAFTSMPDPAPSVLTMLLVLLVLLAVLVLLVVAMGVRSLLRGLEKSQPIDSA